jgi:hypothetical protein
MRMPPSTASRLYCFVDEDSLGRKIQNSSSTKVVNGTCEDCHKIADQSDKVTYETEVILVAEKRGEVHECHDVAGNKK